MYSVSALGNGLIRLQVRTCDDLNILFWNTYRTKNKENIDNCIVDLTMKKGCDIVILAEYIEPIDYLCEMGERIP